MLMLYINSALRPPVGGLANASPLDHEEGFRPFHHEQPSGLHTAKEETSLSPLDTPSTRAWETSLSHLDRTHGRTHRRSIRVLGHRKMNEVMP